MYMHIISSQYMSSLVDVTSRNFLISKNLHPSLTGTCVYLSLLCFMVDHLGQLTVAFIQYLYNKCIVKRCYNLNIFHKQLYHTLNLSQCFVVCVGQPYNQLAIVEAARGNKLTTVFYYVRSLAVRHPFPAAATNLEKLYTKLTKDM